VRQVPAVGRVEDLQLRGVHPHLGTRALRRAGRRGQARDQLTAVAAGARPASSSSAMNGVVFQTSARTMTASAATWLVNGALPSGSSAAR
jgi:hypothetical protein